MKRNVHALVVIAVALPCLLYAQRSAQTGSSPALSRTAQSGEHAVNGATGNDWPSYGGTALSWRYSALASINRANVARLAPAWIFQTTDVQNGLQTTPIVVDGVLYLSTSRSEVYALDGTSGRILWHYAYEPPVGSVISRAHKGVAVANGKVFVGTFDSHVVAVDQKTGSELWNVAAEDSSTCRCGFSAAPLVAKDKVILGSGGRRGYIAAFDINTGRMQWRFYTVPGSGENGSETWAGDSWKYGGAKPWLTGSYDAELGLVYWGAGDPNPMIYGGSREGDNLYSASIVALDVNTGKLRWHFQEVPHDTWDYDSSWETVLLDREVQGRTRKLLMHFGKGGFTYLLDRETGEFLAAYPVNDYIDWVERIGDRGELIGRRDPVEGQVSSSCPGNLGGKSWNQVAYSPRTGLVYSPSMEICQDITLVPPKTKDPEDRGAARFVFKAPPGRSAAYGHLDALDVVTGKKRWSYPYKYVFTGSLLATAGDLVFAGDPEGNFTALDAQTGAKLWSFATGAGHRGGPVTYMARGRQYIATPTGFGDVVNNYFVPLWPEAVRWPSGASLVVFALPESK